MESQGRIRDDAAEKLLLINSRYAQINPEAVFLRELENLKELFELIEIPEVNIESIEIPVIPAITEDNSELKSVCEQNECPKCGFRWNTNEQI